jgi:hypothetical protein
MGDFPEDFKSVLPDIVDALGVTVLYDEVLEIGAVRSGNFSPESLLHAAVEAQDEFIKVNLEDIGGEAFQGSRVYMGGAYWIVTGVAPDASGMARLRLTREGIS